jgi:Fe2+ or Zn2+ uptake regulation protein
MNKNVYKEKILNLLNKKHLLSISEIHKNISDADYSTIFRNVETLVKEGKIKKIVIDKNTTNYEKNGDNHYHFICNNCEKIEEVKDDIKIKDKQITDILIHGYCKNCKK